MSTPQVNKLLATLRDLGHQAEYQKETDQIHFLLGKGKGEYPVFIRLMPGNELLQVLTFIPAQAKEPHMGELARLLHLLNKELDMPGFGMDESNGVVFYRSMLLLNKGEVEASHLRSYLDVAQKVCESFTGAIQMVASGQTTIQSLLEKSEKGPPSS